jgi:hypothetical protein
MNYFRQPFLSLAEETRSPSVPRSQEKEANAEERRFRG